MSAKQGKLVILCLDGLGKQELGKLAGFLSKNAQYFIDCAFSMLDGGLMSSAQAIWAELLTGCPWQQNACAGYTAPDRSLNRTRIITELDLKCPVALVPVMSGGQRHLAINLPLLLPQEPARILMSDGSIPHALMVSPQSLVSNEPFLSYSPRPYTGLGEVFTDPWSVSLSKFALIEQNRLECALKLVRDFDFGIGVIRLSFFDQLAHLIGPGSLLDDELIYAPQIRQFVDFLDEWLYQLFGEVSEVILLSAFSHRPCHYRLSLNELLYEGGFLKFKQPDAIFRRRVDFVSALWNADGKPEKGYEESIYDINLNFHQAYFDCSETVAASPVQGCIYLNALGQFEDGIVQAEEIVELRNEVQQFLNDALKRRSIVDFSIWSANEADRPPFSKSHPLLPDMHVYIPGADLHNNAEKQFRPQDRPRSVHCPEGFVLSRSQHFPPAIKAYEFCHLLRELQ